jgi:hypothetical protein
MTNKNVNIFLRINYIFLESEHLLLIISTAPARELSPQLALRSDHKERQVQFQGRMKDTAVRTYISLL